MLGAHQVCEQTNVAREKPIRQRQTMKPAAFVVNIMPMTPGVQIATVQGEAQTGEWQICLGYRASPRFEPCMAY